MPPAPGAKRWREGSPPVPSERLRRRRGMDGRGLTRGAFGIASVLAIVLLGAPGWAPLGVGLAGAPVVAAAPRSPERVAPALPAATLVPRWENISSPSAPGPVARCCGSMAFDAYDGYLVLFGGNGDCHRCNDTWIDRHGLWENLTRSLPVSPPGSSWTAFAYDPLLQGLVLFGGLLSFPGPAVAGSETWLFRSGRWTQLFPLQIPPARWAGTLVFDPSLGGLVLFGGYSPTTGYLSDTWEYANQSWTPLQSVISPPARWTPAMAYDPQAGGVLLFGGLGSQAAPLADTWVLQGHQWANLTSSLPFAPPAREHASMAWDPSLQQVVLFGGDSCPGTCASSPWGYLNDTWGFSEGSWSNLTVPGASVPSSRCCSAFTYDPTLPAVVLVDGSGALGPAPPSTWAWAPVAAGSLTITSLTPQPANLTLGESTTLEVGVTGNRGLVSYLYAQLPRPCAPSNASIVTCAPGAPGTYAISVEVHDASGNLSSATAWITVTGPGGNGSLSVEVPTPQLTPDALVGFTVGGLFVAAAAVLAVWRRPPVGGGPSPPSA